MNVVLNTDNRLMSGTTLTDEYLHAARTLELHVRRARATIALNGFESAFLPWEERERSSPTASAEIARLRSGAAA